MNFLVRHVVDEAVQAGLTPNKHAPFRLIQMPAAAQTEVLEWVMDFLVRHVVDEAVNSPTKGEWRW